MSRRQREITDALQQIDQRLGEIEHAADKMNTVLMIKDPGSTQAADAYEGLRKQVVASSTARRTHLAQLSAMAVAVSRATDVADLVPQVDEWLGQAGIVRITEVPRGARVQDLFEDADGGTLRGAVDVEVVEPVFIDAQNQVVIRLGRARRIEASPQPSPAQNDEPLGSPEHPAPSAEQPDAAQPDLDVEQPTPGVPETTDQTDDREDSGA